LDLLYYDITNGATGIGVHCDEQLWVRATVIESIGGMYVERVQSGKLVGRYTTLGRYYHSLEGGVDERFDLEGLELRDGEAVEYGFYLEGKEYHMNDYVGLAEGNRYKHYSVRRKEDE
jgi:hypothetical protein